MQQRAHWPGSARLPVVGPWALMTAFALVLFLLPAFVSAQGQPAPAAPSALTPVPPSIYFTPLPPVTYAPDFTLHWTLTGGPGGLSGIDVQYQIDGGPWLDLLVQTMGTAYLVTDAQHGATYGFRARVRDGAGNPGEFPSVAQVQTTIEIYPSVRVLPFDPNTINSTSPVTTSFPLRWTASTPPGTSITQQRVYFRVYDWEGGLRENWSEESPWQTFDGSVTSTAFPVDPLGFGDGVYQFQVTAVNRYGATPFHDKPDAAMIVDLGGAIKINLWLPVIFS